MWINGQPLHAVATEVLEATLERVETYSFQWHALTEELEYRKKREGK